MNPADFLARLTGQADRLETLANAQARVTELEGLLAARPTVEAHQALVDQVSALTAERDARPTVEAHQAIVDQLAAAQEAARITPQAVNAEAARIAASAGLPAPVVAVDDTPAGGKSIRQQFEELAAKAKSGNAADIAARNKFVAANKTALFAQMAD